MADSGEISGDTVVNMCPYDPSHKVQFSKLRRHVLKCERSHPDNPMGRCYYNASHVVLRKNEKEHLRTCPCRKEFAERVEAEELYDRQAIDIPEEDCVPSATAGRSETYTGTTGGWSSDEEMMEKKKKVNYADKTTKLGIPLPVLEMYLTPEELKIPPNILKSQKKLFKDNDKRRIGYLEARNYGALMELTFPRDSLSWVPLKEMITVGFLNEHLRENGLPEWNGRRKIVGMPDSPPKNSRGRGRRGGF